MADAEVLLARAAARAGGVFAVPAVGLAWLLRGTAGALSALGAVVLVVGVLALTARSLAWAAAHGPVALQATALGGFMLRLVIYAGAIVALRPVEAIDGPVLAITVASTTIVVLATEVRFALRNSQIWWVDAAQRRM